jgi:signal transduction histidine kinase
MHFAELYVQPSSIYANLSEMGMKSALRILCLEDDEDDFDIINRVLEKGGLSAVSVRVDSREKYQEALVQFNPEVILSDHALPRFDSAEALSMCQSLGLRVPFILVTGAVSDEFAAHCMKLGADDYILKSNLRRLPSAIENALKWRETERAKLKAMADLATQNEELVKINTEVDSLVYSVSHNLRAPLMSLVGLLNLARSENRMEVIRDYNRLMEGVIHKLDDTLKEILDYSRNARQELQVKPIDFRKLIADAMDRLRFMPSFNLIDVRVDVRDEVEFASDHYRLSVIANNLISNSIKYADLRKPKPYFQITVITTREKAVLQFRDNGIGIDASLVPKIFDMFFRGTTECEGSGLGLYIVKEAVHRLGGTIGVSSEFGSGTVFELEVPNFREEQVAVSE